MLVFCSALNGFCDVGRGEDTGEGIGEVGDAGLGEDGFLREGDHDLVFLVFDAKTSVLVSVRVVGWSFFPPSGLLGAKVTAVERWMCSEGVDGRFWV